MWLKSLGKSDPTKTNEKELHKCQKQVATLAREREETLMALQNLMKDLGSVLVADNLAEIPGFMSERIRASAGSRGGKGSVHDVSGSGRPTSRSSSRDKLSSSLPEIEDSMRLAKEVAELMRGKDHLISSLQKQLNEEKEGRAQESRIRAEQSQKIASLVSENAALRSSVARPFDIQDGAPTSKHVEATAQILKIDQDPMNGRSTPTIRTASFKFETPSEVHPVDPSGSPSVKVAVTSRTPASVSKEEAHMSRPEPDPESEVRRLRAELEVANMRAISEQDGKESAKKELEDCRRRAKDLEETAAEARMKHAELERQLTEVKAAQEKLVFSEKETESLRKQLQRTQAARDILWSRRRSSDGGTPGPTGSPKPWDNDVERLLEDALTRTQALKADLEVREGEVAKLRAALHVATLDKQEGDREKRQMRYVIGEMKKLAEHSTAELRSDLAKLLTVNVVTPRTPRVSSESSRVPSELEKLRRELETTKNQLKQAQHEAEMLGELLQEKKDELKVHLKEQKDEEASASLRPAPDGSGDQEELRRQVREKEGRLAEAESELKKLRDELVELRKGSGCDELARLKQELENLREGQAGQDADLRKELEGLRAERSRRETKEAEDSKPVMLLRKMFMEAEGRAQAAHKELGRLRDELQTRESSEQDAERSLQALRKEHEQKEPTALPGEATTTTAQGGVQPGEAGQAAVPDRPEQAQAHYEGGDGTATAQERTVKRNNSELLSELRERLLSAGQGRINGTLAQEVEEVVGRLPAGRVHSLLVDVSTRWIEADSRLQSALSELQAEQQMSSALKLGLESDPLPDMASLEWEMERRLLVERLEETKTAWESANERLQELTELLSKLTAERDALLQHVQVQSAELMAIQAIQENSNRSELSKKPKKAEADAERSVSKLQSEFQAKLDAADREKQALKSEVQELKSRISASSPSPSSSSFRHAASGSLRSPTPSANPMSLSQRSKSRPMTPRRPSDFSPNRETPLKSPSVARQTPRSGMLSTPTMGHSYQTNKGTHDPDSPPHSPRSEACEMPPMSGEVQRLTNKMAQLLREKERTSAELEAALEREQAVMNKLQTLEFSLIEDSAMSQDDPVDLEEEEVSTLEENVAGKVRALAMNRKCLSMKFKELSDIIESISTDMATSSQRGGTFNDAASDVSRVTGADLLGLDDSMSVRSELDVRSMICPSEIDCRSEISEAINSHLDRHIRPSPSLYKLMSSAPSSPMTPWAPIYRRECEEAREREFQGFLDSSVFRAICEAANTTNPAGVRVAIASQYVALRNLFRFLCQASAARQSPSDPEPPDGSDGVLKLRIREFLTLIKDCKITGPRFTSGQLEMITRNIQRQSQEGLVFWEFLQVLAILAMTRYPQGKSLQQQLESLCRKDLLSRLQVEDPDAFRKDLAQPQVQKILISKYRDVSLAFERTADSSTSPAEVSFRSFFSFCKARGLMKGQLTDKRLQQNVSLSLFDEFAALDVIPVPLSVREGVQKKAATSTALAFKEFAEALCRCAVSRTITGKVPAQNLESCLKEFFLQLSRKLESS